MIYFRLYDCSGKRNYEHLPRMLPNPDEIIPVILPYVKKQISYNFI